VFLEGAYSEPFSFTIQAALSCGGSPPAEILGGKDIRVNQVITGKQQNSAVSTSISGSYVVAWEDNRSGNFDIYFRKYSNSSIPQGDEVRVTTGSANETNPTIAMGPQGNVVVAWQTDQSGTSDIFLKDFSWNPSINGYTPFSEIPVNTAGTGFNKDPAITYLNGVNGKYLIAWDRSSDNNYANSEVLARYNSFNIDFLGDGSFIGTNDGISSTDIIVSQQAATRTSLRPVVSSASIPTNNTNPGNYVIAWESLTSTEAPGIFARVDQYTFPLTVTPLVPTFRVSSIGSFPKRFPSVSMATGGRFVVAWSDVHNGFFNGFPDIVIGINLKKYNPGATNGTEFVVDPGSTASMVEPAVAVDASGNIGVLWTNNSTISFISKANYNSAGTKYTQSPDNKINTSYTTGRTYSSAIAFLSNDELTASWTADCRDGDFNAVSNSRLDFTGIIMGNISF
jgi:hypothetical protein